MSEIKDLAKTIREENEKTRAQTERIANGEGPYAKETIVAAKASLKKQEEQRALAKKTLNISERRMAKAEKLNDQIKAQEQIMAKQKEALEESGIDADKSEKFQKEQLKLEKLKAKRDSTTGAAAAEEENKRKFRETRTGKVLVGIKNGIFGMSKSLGGLVKDKVRAGASSIFGLLKKFALGGLALAAIAFLNSPKFDELLKFIREKVIPKIGPLLENLKTLFNDVMETFDKFLDDPDLKKAMESFKKGDFIEGIKSLGVSIFKKDGLVDNLLTNLTNSILKVMGKSKLNNTVFRALEKFSFRVTNLLIDTINRFIMMIPEPLRPKLLNKIDPETGKEILSDEDKREIELKKEIKRRELANPEIAKQAKKLADMPPVTDADSRMARMKELVKLNKLKNDVVNQLNKTNTMTEESKKILPRLKTQLDGLRPGMGMDTAIDKRIKKQQQFLKVQKRKLEGGSKLSGIELRVDIIKRLEETIKNLKRAKSGGKIDITGSGNNQVNNVNNSRSLYMETRPTSQQSPVISSLNAAAGIF